MAAFALPFVFGLRVGNRLPVHVARVIGPTAGQRDNVVNDVARALVAGAAGGTGNTGHEIQTGALRSLDLVRRGYGCPTVFGRDEGVNFGRSCHMAVADNKLSSQHAVASGRRRQQEQGEH